MKVKVFDEEHEDDLSDAMNAFLQEHAQLHIVDIRFSTAVAIIDDAQIYCFSALLLYEE